MLQCRYMHLNILVAWIIRIHLKKISISKSQKKGSIFEYCGKMSLQFVVCVSLRRKTVQFSTENVRHIHWKLFDKWTKKVFDNKNFDRKCSTATLGVEHFPSLTLLFYNIFRHSTKGFIKYSMGFSIYWKNWLLNLHGQGLFSTF